MAIPQTSEAMLREGLAYQFMIALFDLEANFGD